MTHAVPSHTMQENGDASTGTCNSSTMRNGGTESTTNCKEAYTWICMHTLRT